MRFVLTSLLLCLLIGATPAAAQGSTRPIIRTALEKAEAIPGQPIILRVTLLAPTWFPKAPVFPSFEAPNIMVRLPERASGPVSERVGSETWSGVTRAYRLYPMTVGRFRLPPLPFRVTYADPESRAPITIILRSDEILFNGVAPEGTDGLDPFIAATELILDQTIDGETTDLEPGDAVTREVKVQIEGMSPIFLPELIPESAKEGVAAYPKEPVVTESKERGVLSGERAESVIYVGQAGGRYVAPSISLRWFNLDTRQIETAEVPGFDISVKGDPPPPPSTHQWLAVALWVTGVLLLALLTSITLKRFWPQVAAWRTRRRENLSELGNMRIHPKRAKHSKPIVSATPFKPWKSGRHAYRPRTVRKMRRYPAPSSSSAKPFMETKAHPSHNDIGPRPSTHLMPPDMRAIMRTRAPKRHFLPSILGQHNHDSSS